MNFSNKEFFFNKNYFERHGRKEKKELTFCDLMPLSRREYRATSGSPITFFERLLILFTCISHKKPINSMSLLFFLFISAVFYTYICVLYFEGT